MGPDPQVDASRQEILESEFKFGKYRSNDQPLQGFDGVFGFVCPLEIDVSVIYLTDLKDVLLSDILKERRAITCLNRFCEIHDLSELAFCECIFDLVIDVFCSLSVTLGFDELHQIAT